MAVLLASLGAVGACAAAFYLADRDGWNKRAFDRVRPGMSRAEAERALGEHPDCVVRVGRSEAWFYRGALGTVSCRSRVERLADLPTVYGTLQLLVGPDARVRAIAMDGERSLDTVSGPQFASVLKLLPASLAE